MSCSPKKINPKPIKVIKRTRTLSSFLNINRMAASPTIGNPYFPIFIANNQPVIVVPIFAPRIIPRACFKVNRDAFTKPIVITVLTEEDCTKAVIIIPVKIPKIRLVVKVAKIFFKRGPAIFCIPEDILSIPNKKIPSPPTTVHNT